MKKPVKRMIHLLNHTGTMKIFFAYLIVLCTGAVITWIFEPQVQSLWDGFWFCFVASTTIGFGDITAVTVIGRLAVIFVTLCGILTVAMVPGVVVAYYTEFLRRREEDTVSTFLEKLERLPELNREELQEISDRVKQFNKRHRK